MHANSGIFLFSVLIAQAATENAVKLVTDTFSEDVAKIPHFVMFFYPQYPQSRFGSVIS